MNMSSNNNIHQFRFVGHMFISILHSNWIYQKYKVNKWDIPKKMQLKDNIVIFSHKVFFAF